MEVLSLRTHKRVGKRLVQKTELHRNILHRCSLLFLLAVVCPDGDFYLSTFLTEKLNIESWGGGSGK